MGLSGFDGIKAGALVVPGDTSSSHEPVSTSLENAPVLDSHPRQPAAYPSNGAGAGWSAILKKHIRRA